MSRSFPQVSILIPTCNRASSLNRTLESLSRVDYPADRQEIIIIDDGSTDNTPDMIRQWQQTLGEKRLKSLPVPKGNISYAKNAGLECAAGEIIITTDDDCTFDSDWLIQLVAPFEHPDIGAVGGHDKAPATVTSPLAGAVDYAFTGLLGTGGVRKGGDDARVARFYPRGCNMAFRKTLLTETGPFDPLFFNGEEIDLDYRIQKAGYRLVYQPTCAVYHHRRASIPGLIRQLMGRGISRRMLFLKHPEYKEASYYFPAVMVLGVLAVLLLACFLPFFRFLVAAGIVLYGGMLVAGGLHCLMSRRTPMEALHVPVVLALQHFIYGIGILSAPLSSHYQVLKQSLLFQQRMQDTPHPLRVFISNDGFGTNQGDRAILQVMKDDLHAYFPKVEIRGFLNSWVPGWNDLRTFASDMKWADVFLLGGGQVLHDQTCLLFLCAALLKIVAANFFRTPVICYAVGAGPISFRVGRCLARSILNRCALIIVRDEASKQLLESIGVRTPPIEVTADAAFRLHKESIEPYPFAHVQGNDRPLIAICPRRWFHYGKHILPVRWQFWKSKKSSRLQDPLPGIIAASIDRLVTECNADVVLVPMKQSTQAKNPGQDDDVLCREIHAACNAKDHIDILTGEFSPEQIKTVLCTSELIITMRMHAMILCAGKGIPFVGISLSEKFVDLAQRMDMSDYLIAVDDLSTDKLFELSSRALKNRSELHTKLQPYVQQLEVLSEKSITLLSSWIMKHDYKGHRYE